MTSDLERFLACMEHRPCDRRPNHELGVWPQMRQRWEAENRAAANQLKWDWFVEEPALHLDRKEFVNVNYGFMPAFEATILEETERYVVARNGLGIVTRALKEGSVAGGRTSRDPDGRT